MTGAALRRHPRDLALLALAAAGAWVAILWLLHGGMPMASTVGAAAVAFVAAWTLMMAAMMLPAISPVAVLYARSFEAGSSRRLLEFAAGYLLLWAAIGVAADGIAAAADAVSGTRPGLGRWLAIAALLAIAIYQLTPLKRMCLDHCRSPIAQLLHYANFHGRLRDLRVGLHHGLYCAGCCWPLMLLLIAAGTMNVLVMLVLTAAIAAEKLLPNGIQATRGLALGAAALAITFAASPAAYSLLIGR